MRAEFSPASIERYILSYMSTRCNVRSQHKLPSLQELKSSIMATVLGEENIEPAVKSLIKQGKLIDYDGYLSDREISVL